MKKKFLEFLIGKPRFMLPAFYKELYLKVFKGLCLHR